VVALLLDMDICPGFKHLAKFFNLFIPLFKVFNTFNTVGLNSSNRLMVRLVSSLVFFALQNIKHIKVPLLFEVKQRLDLM
jgi:hypothetical protein